MTKTWYLTAPDATTREVHNLREFARRHDLPYERLYVVARSGNPELEVANTGWRGNPKQLEQNAANPVPARSMVPFALYNPILLRVTSFTAHRPTLAKESGISKQSIWRLCSGQAENVRGWRVSHDAVHVAELRLAYAENSLTEDDI